MKGNLIVTSENLQAFERGLFLLDSSIQEIRRVAYNMLPEVLVRQGLDAALKELCVNFNQPDRPKVSYQSVGIAEREIVQTTALAIYRITEELIINTIKHAAAKTAVVQLIATGDQLLLTVADDGKGFDPAILDKASRGFGWSNIQNRLDDVKGKLDIRSGSGNGTAVQIKINADA
ncbi:MAG: ATP-binding protein [Chitinophagaceae bacterium]